MAKKVAINWTTGLIRETFKIDKKGEDFPLLVRWLDVQNDLTTDEISLLEKRRRKLLPNVQGWNEETLKMKFIALILDMVDYDSEMYQGVYEAELSAVVKNYALKVITDFTVAKVTDDFIQHPYLYFHEYKPKKRTKDPVGQVLLASVIAQELNKDGKPIYGCVVFGELWHFMVVHGSEYAMSDGFRATNADDLQKILLILRKFKDILYNELVPQKSVPSVF